MRESRLDFDRHCVYNISSVSSTLPSSLSSSVRPSVYTVHHFQCFDFNTAFPKDSKWAFDQNESQETRNRRPFRLVCGSTDYSHLSIVMTNPVFPLTTIQGDACWFKMWGNSITSSAADKTISARSREIKIDHAARHDYEIVLSTVGRSAWLPKEEEEEEDQSIDGNRNNNNGGAGSSDEDSDREEDNNVSYWILRIENEEGRDNFLSDLPNMDSDTMREIVGRYKHSKPTASITVLWKKLKEWANQPSKLHWKYNWYNATQLKTRIKEIDTCVKIPATKQAVFDLLIECEIKQKQRNDAIASGEVSSIQSYVQ